MGRARQPQKPRRARREIRAVVLTSDWRVSDIAGVRALGLLAATSVLYGLWTVGISLPNSILHAPCVACLAAARSSPVSGGESPPSLLTLCGVSCRGLVFARASFVALLFPHTTCGLSRRGSVVAGADFFAHHMWHVLLRLVSCRCGRVKREESQLWHAVPWFVSCR